MSGYEENLKIIRNNMNHQNDEILRLKYKIKNSLDTIETLKKNN